MTNESRSRPESRGEGLHRVQIGLRRLTHQMHRLNDAVGSLVDLLPSDLEVLDMIGREGPMSAKDVISATGLHPATLTGMLDRLEQGGWLSRQADSADRRRVIVTARTDRGGEVARHYAPMSKAISALCAEYSADELTLVVEFLERAADAGAKAAATVRESKHSSRTR